MDSLRTNQEIREGVSVVDAESVTSLNAAIDSVKRMVGSLYNGVKKQSGVVALPVVVTLAGSSGVGCSLDSEGQGELFPPGTGNDSGQTDAVWPEVGTDGDGGVEAEADADADADADASTDVSEEADVLTDAPEEADAPMDAPEEADAPMDAPEEADAPTDAPEEADAPTDAPEEADAPTDAPEEADVLVEAEAGPTCLTVNLQDMASYTYAIFQNDCDAANIISSQLGQYEHGVTSICLPEGKTYTLVLQVIDSGDTNSAEMEFDYVGQIGPQSGIAIGEGNNQAMTSSTAPLYCNSSSGSWVSVNDVDPTGNKAKFNGNVWSGGVTPPVTYFKLSIQN